MHSFNSWIRESTIIISHNFWPNRILSFQLFYVEPCVFKKKLVFDYGTHNFKCSYIEWTCGTNRWAALLEMKVNWFKTSWLGVQSLNIENAWRWAKLFIILHSKMPQDFNVFYLILCAELSHSWPPYGCIWGSWFCDSGIHIESTSIGHTILPPTVLLPGN